MPITDGELVAAVQAIYDANLHPDDETLVVAIFIGDINAEEAAEETAEAGMDAVEAVLQHGQQLLGNAERQTEAIRSQATQLRQQIQQRLAQGQAAPPAQPVVAQDPVPAAPPAPVQVAPVVTPPVQAAPAQINPLVATPVQAQPIQPAQPVSGDDVWFALAEKAAQEFSVAVSDMDRNHLRMFQYREEKNARQWACRNRLWTEHRQVGGQKLRNDFKDLAWDVVNGRKTLAETIAEAKNLNASNAPQQAPLPVGPTGTPVAQSDPNVGPAPANITAGPQMANAIDKATFDQACVRVAAIASDEGIKDQATLMPNIQLYARKVARAIQTGNEQEVTGYLAEAREFFQREARGGNVINIKGINQKNVGGTD